MGWVNTGGTKAGSGVQTIAESPAEKLRRVQAEATPQGTSGSPFDVVLQESPQGASQPSSQAPLEVGTAPDVDAFSVLDDVQGETFSDPAMEARERQRMETFREGSPEMDEESQRVTPMSEREREGWAYKVQNKEVDPTNPDGGFTNRVLSVADKIRNYQGHKSTFSPGSNLGKITMKMEAVDFEASYGQDLELDSTFKQVVAARAEKYFADRMAGAKETTTPLSPKEQAEIEQAAIPNVDIKKAKDSAQLGQEINREFQRERNAQRRVDTSSYNELSEQEATILGDYAKEIYAEAMGDKIGRSLDDDGMVVFHLTPEMVAELDASKQLRDQMAPSQQVIEPLTSPPPKANIEGEKGKYTKEVAGKLGKGVTDAAEVQEALANQASIPHYVLPRRMALLFATGLPTLMGNPAQFQQNPVAAMAAEINGLGPSKMRDLAVTAEIKAKKKEHYNPQAILQTTKKGIANAIMAIAKGRNRANYLSYYVQGFQGRQSPEQTHFNPTTSKHVRAVTGNVTPTKVVKGGRYFDSAVQAYAMLIGKDVDRVGLDAFLPEFRVQFLRTQAPGLEAWGRRLKDVLNQSIPKEKAEAVAQAIAEGKPMNDPSFPQVGLLSLDPNQDAELIAAIQKKGEDGIAYMDALMDFADFMQAMRDGKPHYTHINPTIDGKTNGPAANGLQMGDEAMATMTGVLRSPDAIHAVQNDHDIRDELEQVLQESLKSSKFQGTYQENEIPALVHIAEHVYSHRPLNKEVTMTFGYGKEIDSFINSIIETVVTKAQDNPSVKSAVEYLNNRGFDDTKIAQILISKYIPAITEVMSPDAIEARALHRGVALVHGLADTLMYYTSAVGTPIYMGGKSPEGGKKAGSYFIMTDEGMASRKANMYPSRATSAASKVRAGKDGNSWEDVGGKAFSGSVVAPIQSMDAATVVKSFSGPSWKMLSHQTHGHPYMHQVYDAFKMDVATYHYMMDEINQNWAKIGLTWSALEQGKIALRSRALPALREKVKAIPDGGVQLAEYMPVLADLLEGTPTKSGDLVPSNLIRKLEFLAPNGMTGKVRREWATKAAYKILEESGMSLSMGQAVGNRKQVGRFISSLLQYTRLQERIAVLYKKTEQKRAKLAPKVLDKKNKIYQYYAH